jgi:hypothetical protein
MFSLLFTLGSAQRLLPNASTVTTSGGTGTALLTSNVPQKARRLLACSSDVACKVRYKDGGTVLPAGNPFSADGYVLVPANTLTPLGFPVRQGGQITVEVDSAASDPTITTWLECDGE